MKFNERVVVRRLRKLINIAEPQFELRPNMGTLDVLFVLKTLRGIQKKMFRSLYLFCRPEKAFNRVPRKVIEWVLEVLVWTIMSMYDGTQV